LIEKNMPKPENSPLPENLWQRLLICQ